MYQFNILKDRGKKMTSFVTEVTTMKIGQLRHLVWYMKAEKALKAIKTWVIADAQREAKKSSNCYLTKLQVRSYLKQSERDLLITTLIQEYLKASEKRKTFFERAVFFIRELG